MLSEQVFQTAQLEHDLHPQATLIDYYKLFFQATFGPNHYIHDPDAALDSLTRELASAKSFEAHLYQKIGLQNTFYRVNLKVIHQKLICQADFFTAFLRSSKFKTSTSLDQWASQWNQIEAALKKSPFKIYDFEEASRCLEHCVTHKNYILSHSDIYRRIYQPHYRIFTEMEFKKLGIEKRRFFTSPATI